MCNLIKEGVFCLFFHVCHFGLLWVTEFDKQCMCDFQYKVFCLSVICSVNFCERDKDFIMKISMRGLDLIEMSCAQKHAPLTHIDFYIENIIRYRSLQLCFRNQDFWFYISQPHDQVNTK